MSEISLTSQALASLAGLLLLLFVWRVTAGLPAITRFFGRTLLTLLAFGPIVLFLVLGGEPLPTTRAIAPSPEARTGASPEAASGQAARQATAEDGRGPGQAGKTATVSPGPADREATRTHEPAAQPTTGTREPPAGQQPAPAEPAQAPQSREAKSRAAARSTGQDLVPVFYGTDRAPSPEAGRLDYTWQRGRKLQLGRALVKVPRAYQAAEERRPWAITMADVEPGSAETGAAGRTLVMKEVKALTKDEFLALVRERLGIGQRFKDHALVFVHGYNTSFDHAVFRAAQLAYDLAFDGAPFLYSWPSGGDVASYTYDRDSAEQAEPYLREFLELVVKESGAKSVSIVVVDMGSPPALKALREIKGAIPAGVAINQLVLAAPDVDRETLETVAGSLKGLVKGMTLYAAGKDRALAVSRRFHGGVPRAGDVPETGPLVVPGVDTIDASGWGLEGLGRNDSLWAENDALLKDIGALLQTGERPPEKREAKLERVETAKGAYWRASAQ